MAAATQTFSPYDEREPSQSDDQRLSTPNRRFMNPNPTAVPPRPGQHLDDADLLTWRRHFANMNSREQNVISSSADDVSQLEDNIQYPYETFGHDYSEIEDDELHFDNGNTYDYDTDIRERLKKANEEFNQDNTPVELKHPQRVSFDAIVKAVDIVQDPQELENSSLLTRPPVSPVVEEPPATNQLDDDSTHQYTVPLNDTQSRDGPTLLEVIKAKQFHGITLTGDRWSSTMPNENSNPSTQEDLSSTKSNTNNNNTNTNKPTDMTTKSSSPSPQKSMVVAINGEFKLQSEDDYTSKQQTGSNDSNNNNKKKTSNGPTKPTFAPTPPKEAKTRNDSLKSQAPSRSHSGVIRPKSSDSSKRTESSNNITSKSWSDSKNKNATNNQQRPKSAGTLVTLQPYTMRPLSGVDFDALNRKAAEEKREKDLAERRKQKEEEAKRKYQLELAKESYEQWIKDKDAERKRFEEEKRLEKEEHDARQTKCEKELAELREKRYKEWVERKNREIMLANEFRKLQAEEEEIESGGSSASLDYIKRRENHRAYQRWLRQKAEQAREEQRQIRDETRRLRRRQRRSRKRSQLHQDLQLAKSFGYS